MGWETIINKSCEIGYTNSIVNIIHELNEMLPEAAELIKIETQGYLQRLEDLAGKTKSRGGVQYIHDAVRGMLFHCSERGWIGPDTYGTLNSQALELLEQYLECTGESLR